MENYTRICTRFFYLDSNWTNERLNGPLSILTLKPEETRSIDLEFSSLSSLSSFSIIKFKKTQPNNLGSSVQSGLRQKYVYRVVLTYQKSYKLYQYRSLLLQIGLLTKLASTLRKPL